MRNELRLLQLHRQQVLRDEQPGHLFPAQRSRAFVPDCPYLRYDEEAPTTRLGLVMSLSFPQCDLSLLPQHLRSARHLEEMDAPVPT